MSEIAPTARSGGPLSFAQQRMWLSNQLEPGSPVYNRAKMSRWRGRLDPQLLEQSFTEVVRRHEILRTRFRTLDGQPVQEVLPPGSFTLPVVDFEPLSEGLRLDLACRDAVEFSRLPFDLSRSSLLGARLLRLGPKDHLLVIVAHHIVIDGWSMGILLDEVEQLYSALASGRPSPLPELPLQYLDYASWEREELQGERLQRELGYWREQLSGAPPVLDLPLDRPRPSAAAHQGGEISFTLPEELVTAVVSLSRSERATPFMAFLATFALLLGRWSGQNDVVVGIPIAGRIRKDLERLIGCFPNTLALRTRWEGDPSFRTLLRRVREVALGAYAHQQLPFERLVEQLGHERSLSQAPVFQVLFNYRNYPAPRTLVDGLEVEELEVAQGTAKFDLELNLMRRGSELRGTLVYDCALFTAETVFHLVEQFRGLLEQAVAAPESSVASYSLVTPAGRTVLPDPALPLPEPHYPSVIEAFRSAVAAGPMRTAVTQGAKRWTYRELADSMAALSGALGAAGVRPGDVVAVTGSPSPGLVASMLAILSCRAVLLPIAPELPCLRRDVMLREARASVMLQVGTGEPDPATPDDLLVVSVDPRTGAALNLPAPLPHARGDAAGDPLPSDPAYIFFTSGTTGTPKGVLGIHKGLGHFLAWQRDTFALGPADRCAQLVTLSFDGVLRDVFLPLVSGATLCLPPSRLDPAAVLGWIREEGITTVHVVPSLARLWLDDPLGGSRPTRLRCVFLAGEPLSDTLVHRWREVVPGECRIVNLYGPTETTMVKSAYSVPLEVRPGVQPAGKPLPSTQLLVLSRGGRLCGVNEPGEIVIRTPFRTLGYVNAPESQQRHFGVNPLTGDPADIVYRTGDLGRSLPNGDLLVLGRIDQQVKIRGVRVEPEEIAAVLAQHPDVGSCAVVARVDGSKEPTLVGYVVARNGARNGPALRAYLANRLPLTLVPSAIVFLPRLPLTSNGKLDQRALPEPVPISGTGPPVPPRTPIEEALAGIWAEVLGQATVGVHDDFFALGGHSLRAVQVIARTRVLFGVDLPLSSVFLTPTVAGLALSVTERLVDEAVG